MVIPTRRKSLPAPGLLRSWSGGCAGYSIFDFAPLEISKKSISPRL
jgi:hypothetical protein